jgi:dTDP-4-dehydrorhamnose 3,5-epimerase
LSVVIIETELPGVLIIGSDIYTDQRGFFRELYHKDKYCAAGLDKEFVQDNHSRSVKGVLRGLHYQLNKPQGKLVTALSGEIFDVAVDVRSGSPYFGKWTGVYLSPENKRQIYIPEGFAHGFCVLSDTADVVYKCTDLYSPGDEYGLLWSDEALNIDWPVSQPIVSQKDQAYSELTKIPAELLPIY